MNERIQSEILRSIRLAVENALSKKKREEGIGIDRDGKVSVITAKNVTKDDGVVLLKLKTWYPNREQIEDCKSCKKCLKNNQGEVIEFCHEHKEKFVNKKIREILLEGLVSKALEKAKKYLGV